MTRVFIAALLKCGLALFFTLAAGARLGKPGYWRFRGPGFWYLRRLAWTCW